MAFLLSISENSGVSRVYSFLSAISFFYRRKGLTSPCDDVRVKMFMKGLKREASSQPVKKALPLTLEILEKAVLSLDTDDSLVRWRTVWRMVITFSCFMRFDDLIRLKVMKSL
jgi:hypothetical protein